MLRNLGIQKLGSVNSIIFICGVYSIKINQFSNTNIKL